MVESMTAEQVAEQLKVTMPTVYRWAREGILPSHRLGRTLRFNKDDVESMLSEPSPSTAAGTPDAFIDVIADAVIAQLKARGYLDSKEQG